ncbi:hypothetical protein G7074_21645 [Pedobacter sp. HDW13]|uniref:hypothetical protein n=1 Tax=Pedobacter sp. HDW13 TaxID=2714940 RepID=UPI00140C7AE0|nr:hypothetical protein [Pedobacter sp. HDW13]QIL41638.1 hypothetical protein G7074_21645 [Pedobacter sp. HDW13]
MKITRQLISLILLTLMAFHATAQKRLKPDREAYHWFSFKWYSDSVSGKYFDKLAVLLPVKIDTIKANFVAQFDLGANETVLYGNDLKNYFPSQQYLYSLLDTSHKATSDGGLVSYPSKKITLHIGSYQTKDFFVFDKYGDGIPKDSLYTPSLKHIGTIGASFTKNKVLVMDFPNKRMCLLDSITRYWASKASFVDCRLKNGRIQLPFTINGQQHWMMFDTGASVFPLSTDKTFWETIVDAEAQPDTLKVNSWGEKVPYYGAVIKSDIYLGKYKLPKQKAWYNENKRLLDFNKGEGITGTTGNAYFFNHVIIIDFKNKRFGVVK